ncbi:MAG TPA: hypothetical protein VFR18_07090 [Terriglobia bacterium]|nr:hypothetical protein [Terriglobia bacterium]
MKIQTALTLAILLAIVPEVSAQRGGRGGGGGPAGPPAGGGGARGGGPVVSRPVAAAAASQRTETRVSPLIGTIGNPVPPVIPYRGNPSLGNSAARQRPVAASAVGREIRNDRRDRHDDVIVVGGGYLDPFYPFYSPYYYYPYMMPPPIPGQLPGVYAVPEQVEVLPPDPALYALPPAPPAGGAAADFIEVYEPRMIITPPEPDRTVEPPALGTARADVLSRYGQPWGTISTKSKETLYFRSLTVILEEGKVSEVR